MGLMGSISRVLCLASRARLLCLKLLYYASRCGPVRSAGTAICSGPRRAALVRLRVEDESCASAGVRRVRRASRRVSPQARRSCPTMTYPKQPARRPPSTHFDTQTRLNRAVMQRSAPLRPLLPRSSARWSRYVTHLTLFAARINLHNE